MTQFGSLLRNQARKIQRLLDQELWKARLEAKDRAHLATRGDRPFVGCRPCEAGDVSALSEPKLNPDAKPRP